MQLNWRPILYINGAMLAGLSSFMIPPTIICFFNDNLQIAFKFLIAFMLTALSSALLILVNYEPKRIILGVREIFILTFLSWLLCSFFGCLPFYINTSASLINSLFESVSALTTTGITAYANVEELSSALLIWRALLQWLGGIGIIVMALTIFPILKIGGMQLFRSEFSDRTEKILPRVSQIAGGIVSVYSIFTFLGFVALKNAGMNLTDAFCHAASAISTGGFSTKINGILAFNNLHIEYILMVLMLLGGSPLIMYVKAWSHGWQSITQNQQFKSYLLIVLIACVGLSALMFNHGESWLASLQNGCFIAISMITTCGFVKSDYMLYSSSCLVFIFIISGIGGCTGSTTGGIKIFRLEILWQFIKSYLFQLYKPAYVKVPIYQSQPLNENIFTTVLGFIAIYVLLILFLALMLSCGGMDFTNSISGAVACISNVGAGQGAEIGPTATVENLNIFCKIWMMLGMITGRLELFSVLVLFVPNFWRS